jgi:hypothetical protein
VLEAEKEAENDLTSSMGNQGKEDDKVARDSEK